MLLIIIGQLHFEKKRDRTVYNIKLDTTTMELEDGVMISDDKTTSRPDGYFILEKLRTFYQESVFLKQGFEMRNSFQKKKGVTIYPAGVFVSKNLTSEQRISCKTVAVHYGAGTWMTEEERRGLKIR